jgi:hypothetical protein
MQFNLLELFQNILSSPHFKGFINYVYVVFHFRIPFTRLENVLRFVSIQLLRPVFFLATSTGSLWITAFHFVCSSLQQ